MDLERRLVYFLLLDHFDFLAALPPVTTGKQITVVPCCLFGVRRLLAPDATTSQPPSPRCGGRTHLALGHIELNSGLVIEWPPSL